MRIWKSTKQSVRSTSHYSFQRPLWQSNDVLIPGSFLFETFHSVAYMPADFASPPPSHSTWPVTDRGDEEIALQPSLIPGVEGGVPTVCRAPLCDGAFPSDFLDNCTIPSKSHFLALCGFFLETFPSKSLSQKFCLRICFWGTRAKTLSLRQPTMCTIYVKWSKLFELSWQVKTLWGWGGCCFFVLLWRARRSGLS